MIELAVDEMNVTVEDKRIAVQFQGSGRNLRGQRRDGGDKKGGPGEASHVHLLILCITNERKKGWWPCQLSS